MQKGVVRLAPAVIGKARERTRRLGRATGRLASSAVHTDTAALRLYERWRRTGSETLAAELADLGLCPVASAEAVN